MMIESCEWENGEGVDLWASDDTFGRWCLEFSWNDLAAIPHVAALHKRIAELETAVQTTNSYWACPDCGGLAVANRIGWRCTRCGAHREWNSETCPGDYCEDGCTRCVGTP